MQLRARTYSVVALFIPGRLSGMARSLFILAADATRDHPSRSLPRQADLDRGKVSRVFHANGGFQHTQRQGLEVLAESRLMVDRLQMSIAAQLPDENALPESRDHQAE